MYHAVKVIPCFCSFSVDWYFYLLLQDWTSVKNIKKRNLWRFINTSLKTDSPPRPLSGGDAIWSNQNQSYIIPSHCAGFHFLFFKTTWCFLNLKMAKWQLVIKVQSVFKHHKFYKNFTGSKLIRLSLYSCNSDCGSGKMLQPNKSMPVVGDRRERLCVRLKIYSLTKHDLSLSSSLLQLP